MNSRVFQGLKWTPAAPAAYTAHASSRRPPVGNTSTWRVPTPPRGGFPGVHPRTLAQIATGFGISTGHRTVINLLAQHAPGLLRDRVGGSRADYSHSEASQALIRKAVEERYPCPPHTLDACP